MTSRRHATDESTAPGSAAPGRLHRQTRSGVRTRFPSGARLHAGAILIALAAQMLLPAAHATELERVARSAPAAEGTHAEGAPASGSLVPIAHYAARHDPASCAVCRSLVHSGQVLAGAATLALAASPCASPPAAAADVPSEATDRAHPPRAPPTAGRHPVA